MWFLSSAFSHLECAVKQFLTVPVVIFKLGSAMGKSRTFRVRLGMAIAFMPWQQRLWELRPRA